MDIATPHFTVRPEAPAPWPGVVVIHEGNGMSPQLLRFSERLAREGYAVVAPDLFFRSGGSEAGDFATLIGNLRPDEVRADLDGAVAALRALGASAVGITGFCMGGSFAYRAAVEGVDVACAASFYGGFIANELGARLTAAAHAGATNGTLIYFKEAFSGAIRQVYWVGLGIVMLGAVLTSLIPELPLRRTR